MAPHQPKILIHGGAWDIPSEYHEAHIKGVREAAEIGMKILLENENDNNDKNNKKPSSSSSSSSSVAPEINETQALQAVLHAVVALENNPTFDAGKGSFLNNQGIVEMDAMIMNGKDYSLGSVICVKKVKNPILLANEIRLQTDHCMLAGEGAESYAAEVGMEVVETEDLLVGRELELYKEIQNSKEKVIIRDFFAKPEKMGTVGAVAIDAEGNIACATSTGGTPNKKWGRVGDTPLPGAGGYANHFAGVSTTGWGESIMKIMLAKTAVDGVELKLDAQTAADRSIRKLQEEVNGLGGLILITKTGEAVFSYNTPYMARALATENGIEYATV